MANMNSIWPKTKELMKFHFGCHGNPVTIAMRYVADAYSPNENLIQLKANVLQSEMYFSYYFDNLTQTQNHILTNSTH